MTRTALPCMYNVSSLVCLLSHQLKFLGRLEEEIHSFSLPLVSLVSEPSYFV